MSEQCVRCKSVGSDRRTLGAYCFYALEETGVPFTKTLLFHADPEGDFTEATPPQVLELPDGGRIGIGAGTYTTSSTLTPQQVHTLRICKRCRSEWIGSLREWFFAPPQGEDGDADVPSDEYKGPGTGIYVRVNGVNKEVTREEWEAMQKRNKKGEVL